jgi:hypothetical protein
MPGVFANLLNNISQIFQPKIKQKKGKSKTKLKSEDIHNPQEAVDFLRALADRIEAGDFAGPSLEGARRVDGTPMFECDIDLKEDIEKEEIKNSVKIKMEWVEALEEHSVQAIKDEDLLAMDERYLNTLDEDDLLIVSQKMLHLIKKEHKDHNKTRRKREEVEVKESDSEEKPRKAAKNPKNSERLAT